TNHGKGAASGGTLRIIHPVAGALDADGAPGCSVTSNMMTCTDIDLPAPATGQGAPTLTRTFKIRVTDPVTTTSLTLETSLPEDADEEPLNDKTTVTLVVEGPDLAV